MAANMAEQDIKVLGFIYSVLSTTSFQSHNLYYNTKCFRIWERPSVNRLMYTLFPFSHGSAYFYLNTLLQTLLSRLNMGFRAALHIYTIDGPLICFQQEPNKILFNKRLNFIAVLVVTVND